MKMDSGISRSCHTSAKFECVLSLLFVLITDVFLLVCLFVCFLFVVLYFSFFFNSYKYHMCLSVITRTLLKQTVSYMSCLQASLSLFLVKINETGEITDVFLEHLTLPCIPTYSDVKESICFTFTVVIQINLALRSYTSSDDLDIHPRSQECEKVCQNGYEWTQGHC